jgi:hypothetical protein
MAPRILRLLPPASLLLIGLAFVVYGATAHHAAVLFEEEVTPPTPTPPPMPLGPGRPAFTPPPPPPMPPPEPVHVLRTAVEPEQKLILEATRGGVTRIADGRIKRTYMGAPPSGCPT